MVDGANISRGPPVTGTCQEDAQLHHELDDVHGGSTKGSRRRRRVDPVAVAPASSGGRCSRRFGHDWARAWPRRDEERHGENEGGGGVLDCVQEHLRSTNGARRRRGPSGRARIRRFPTIKRQARAQGDAPEQGDLKEKEKGRKDLLCCR